MALARGKWRQWAPPPAERVPPFLLVDEAGDLVLLSPFPKRPQGPSLTEIAAVEAVAGHLASRLPVAPCWIDNHGTVTRAVIGDGQVRRRLIDNASFEVRRQSKPVPPGQVSRGRDADRSSVEEKP